MSSALYNHASSLPEDTNYPLSLKVITNSFSYLQVYGALPVSATKTEVPGMTYESAVVLRHHGLESPS